MYQILCVLYNIFRLHFTGLPCIMSYMFAQGPPPAYPASEAPPVYDPPPPYPGSPDAKIKVLGHDDEIRFSFSTFFDHDVMLNQEEVNDEEANKEGKVATVRE